VTDADIVDLDTLRRAIAAGVEVRWLFFWGHTAKGARIGPHVLSQWYPTTFVCDGERYISAEHYMMAEKAKLFGDEASRRAILAADNPGKAKALGRAVSGFDTALWVQHRFEIVVRGNLAKFGQNAELKRYLLETGQKVLVEASPRDSIWGIGLAADDPRAEQPAEWPGLNLLGFALMRVRADLA
jgi:ribA/ribD-fused uncharacterized protein